MQYPSAIYWLVSFTLFLLIIAVLLLPHSAFTCSILHASNAMHYCKFA